MLTALDESIAQAFTALTEARETMERCPSAENIKAMDADEREMNRLLDLRSSRVPATIGSQK